MSDADVGAAAPAIVLAAGGAAIALIAMSGRVGPRAIEWLGALVGLASAAVAIVIGTGGTAVGTALARDGASAFFATAIGATIAVGLAVAAADPRRRRRLGGAAVALVLASAAGAALLVAADDLVTVVVALALASAPQYAITARGGGRHPLGHLLLGATASAVAAYGIALLYAATGEIGYGALGRATHDPLYLAGLGLVTAGLVGHAAIAPGRPWTIAPRVAVLAAILRLASATRSGEAFLDWEASLAILAAAAIAFAGIAAVSERRVARLLAFATIAQVGYVAVALAAAAPAAAAFGIVVYAALATGAFGAVALVEADDPTLRDLAGLLRRRPALAAALGIFVLGLIGLPPAAGFAARLVALEAAIRAQLLWLVIVGALVTAVNAVAYVRIVLACFAAPRLDAVAPPRARVGAGVLVVLAVAVVAAGLVPAPLLDAAQRVRF